jgi:hypothetical protein
MKKLLQGSIILSLFSVSILMLQMSCGKFVIAESPIPGNLQQNKIVFFKSVPPSVGQHETWIANYDGSGAIKVNIVLPSNVVMAGENGIRLSPDGKTMFFVGREDNGFNFKQSIYSCKIDGSDVKRIVEYAEQGKGLWYLGGAY